jgi:biotin carboxylase
MAKPRVLLVCPTAWDEAEIARCGLEARYDLARFGSYDTAQPGGVDPVAMIDEAVARFGGRIDGVVATHDYPGSLMAAAVAERLGLPGPGLAPLLRAQHKVAARAVQAAALPEAVPRWRAFTPGEGADGLELPAFVRPAKSVTSRLAQQVDDEADLARYLAEAAAHLEDFVRPFNALWRAAGMEGPDASQLLAEEIVEGVQTTVEGFVQGGVVTILGVVDSVMFEGTQSFRRFDHPSSLPAEVQRRMTEGSRALIEAHALDDTLFNVEWFWSEPEDRVTIIELNPRMSYQFADLFEKRDGLNTYELQMQVATGRPASFAAGGGDFDVASSVVLRLKDDKRITRYPSVDEVAAALEAFPDARVHLFGEAGQRLSDMPQDAWRYRYGCINVGGADVDDAERRARALHDSLGIVLDD